MQFSEENTPPPFEEDPDVKSILSDLAGSPLSESLLQQRVLQEAGGAAAGSPLSPASGTAATNVEGTQAISIGTSSSGSKGTGHHNLRHRRERLQSNASSLMELAHDAPIAEDLPIAETMNSPKYQTLLGKLTEEEELATGQVGTLNGSRNIRPRNSCSGFFYGKPEFQRGTGLWKFGDELGGTNISDPT